MKFLAPLLAALLTACAADAPDYDGMPTDLSDSPRWCPEERPAHIVMSDALEPDCVEAVQEATEFWLNHGATYLTLAVVPDSQLTPEQPWPRFIQVVALEPEDADESGNTRIHRITHECIDSAEMRLRYCRAQTATHELGHALGLVHSADPRNLMFKKALLAIDGPYGLTAAQLEHVK